MNPDIETAAALAVHRALYEGEDHWDDAARVHRDLPAAYEHQARRIATAVLEAVKVDLERAAHHSGWLHRHLQQQIAEQDPSYRITYTSPWEPQQ